MIYYFNMIKDLKTTELLELCQTGNFTNWELHNKLGVSVSSIIKWKNELRDLGYPIKDKKLKIIDRAEKYQKLLEFAKIGYTNRQLSIVLGVKEATIQLLKRELRSKGIQIERRKGRPVKDLNGVTNIGILDKEDNIDFNIN